VTAKDRQIHACRFLPNFAFFDRTSYDSSHRRIWRQRLLWPCAEFI